MIKNLITFLILMSLTHPLLAREIKIGAKKFTEGNISAYLILQELKKINKNLDIEVLENLGGTGIVTSAIKNKKIDIYIDYTGTLVNSFQTNYKNLEQTLYSHNIILGPNLGFNNSYGLAVKANNSISRISEISLKHRVGISHEFFKRNDGYKYLSKAYDLQNVPVTLEHSLLFQSLNSESLDVIEVYTTDAKILKNNLKVLSDDRDFFSRYDAVVLVNVEFYNKNKKMIDKLFTNIKERFTNKDIIEANYLVEIDGLRYDEAAGKLSGVKLLAKKKENVFFEILPYFLEHLKYLVITIFLCVLIGIPIGGFAAKSKAFERVSMTLISIFQTIPSLALLVFLIPLFGLGELTTIIALTLYGLLPIAKSTHSAISNIPKELSEFSDLIRMSKIQKFLLVEIPLAAPEILTGIKITSIATIGVTVIAAFVGAGGLGTLIVTGLSLNKTSLILKGAIPSALMALIVELFFQKIVPILSRRRI